MGARDRAPSGATSRRFGRTMSCGESQGPHQDLTETRILGPQQKHGEPQRHPLMPHIRRRANNAGPCRHPIAPAVVWGPQKIRIRVRAHSDRDVRYPPPFGALG